MQPLQEFYSNREDSVSISSHTLAAMNSHKRILSRDPRSILETHSAREKGHSPRIEKCAIFLNYEQMKQPKEIGRPCPNSLKRNFNTRLLPEEQRNQTLSQARSEMNMQVWRVESADMALRVSNRQIHSHRMEHYQANEVHENSRREHVMLRAELAKREMVHQETRSRTLQELESLKKICCAGSCENSAVENG